MAFAGGYGRSRGGHGRLRRLISSTNRRINLSLILPLVMVVFLSRSTSSLLLASSTTMATSASTTTPTKLPALSSPPPPPTSPTSTSSSSLPPPIVYTIAGSDSGGGAGIQADLHALHALGCHGCSAITCLTAQSSVGVTQVHVPPATFLQQQLTTLADDLPPVAIKIGMLGTKELAQVVGSFLADIKKDQQQHDQKVWVVLDPVMISTSGSKLLDDDAVQAMVKHVFPHADILTPNKFEAEALLQRPLQTPADVEEAARELLKRNNNCRAVLIKGGHTLLESLSSSSSSNIVDTSLPYAQDFLLSSDPPPSPEKERLCDATTRGVWFRSPRWDSQNTHGTGCTLSSAMAAALALGEQNRRLEDGNLQKVGAVSATDMVDACCLAKAYVSAGIQLGRQLGAGPGPVVQTTFPSSSEHFPSIVSDPTQDDTHFRPMQSSIGRQQEGDGDDVPILGRSLPIVDTVEWVERLCKTPGVTDIQLRIKGVDDPVEIANRVQQCQAYCEEHGVRLWINDHWKAAVDAGCFGVHVGQEDLAKCVQGGGLDEMRSNNVALGISTHSYGELAVALGVRPSYISMGPVFATSSKKVGFYPQGLFTVRKWRELIPPCIPLVTIGGINDVEAARANREAGSDCVAVIAAITKSDNVPASVAQLNEAMTES